MRSPLIRLMTLALLFTGAARSAEWRSLPLVRDGKVAPEWQQVGWGTMVVVGDEIRTEPDEKGLGLLVYTKERFGDCKIRVVYRPEDGRDNSGVHVRMDEGILKWPGRASIASTDGCSD